MDVCKKWLLTPTGLFWFLEAWLLQTRWGRLAIPHGGLFIAFYCRVPLLCYTPNVHHLVFYWVVGFLVGLYYATFFGAAFSITLVLSPQKEVASRSVRSVCKGLKVLCEASVRFWEKQWVKVPTFPTEDSGTSKIWANYFYFPKLLNLNGSEPPTTISVDPGSWILNHHGPGAWDPTLTAGFRSIHILINHQHPPRGWRMLFTNINHQPRVVGTSWTWISPQNQRPTPSPICCHASLGKIYGEARNWCRFKSSCTVSLFANSIALGKKQPYELQSVGIRNVEYVLFFHKLTRPEQLFNSLGISGLGFLLLHIIFLRFQMKMQENAGEYSFFFLHLSSPYIFPGKRTKHENIWFDDGCPTDGRPWDPYHNFNWEPLISTSWNSKTALPKNHETSGPWYS